MKRTEKLENILNELWKYDSYSAYQEMLSDLDEELDKIFGDELDECGDKTVHLS